MSDIQRYKEHCQKIGYAQHWASKLGCPYYGGGGGTGSIHEVKVTAVLYHQECDGATNYHEMPDALKAAINAQVKERFPEILAGAMASLEAKRAELAQLALAEHSKLMLDAGLETTP